MQPFLKSIADHLVEVSHGDFEKYSVVLPSRRAGTFLKKFLSEHFEKTKIAPEIITIPELMESLSGYKVPDNMVLLLYLYEEYAELENEKAESFEDFLNWGSILLNDFNEVDSHLLDTKKLYSDLRKIKDIENWSLNADELTEHQKTFNRNWQKTGEIYDRFKNRCFREGFLSTGLIQRYISENIEQTLEDLPKEYYLFAGLSAMTKAEEKFVKTITDSQKGKLFVDGDSYYTQDKLHEAGLFIRNIQQKFGNVEWVSENWKKMEKKINVYGIPQEIGQAKVAGKVLENLKYPENHKSTAL
ncbi:MAG: hypothetical protein ABEH43_07035, partial [Flavobacteriales bacterium]